MPENEQFRVAGAPGSIEPPRVLLPVDNPDISIREISYSSKPLLRELIETIFITLLIFLAVQAVVQNRRVDGESMLPTLYNEEYLLIDKLSYTRWQDTPIATILPQVPLPNGYIVGQGPQRGDIVVLHPPTDSRDYIKRIIALGGEQVQVKSDDGVYVNGQKLPEPYIKDPPDYNYGPTEVPVGSVFVLGDNRRNSSDSHIWGMLKQDAIVGKAWISYWPRELWGVIPSPSYAEINKQRP